MHRTHDAVPHMLHPTCSACPAVTDHQGACSTVLLASTKERWLERAAHCGTDMPHLMSFLRSGPVSSLNSHHVSSHWKPVANLQQQCAGHTTTHAVHTGTSRLPRRTPASPRPQTASCSPPPGAPPHTHGTASSYSSMHQSLPDTQSLPVRAPLTHVPKGALRCALPHTSRSTSSRLSRPRPCLSYEDQMASNLAGTK